MSDAACVVQSVATTEHESECDAVVDDLLLCNSDVLSNLEKKLCPREEGDGQGYKGVY